MSKTFVFVTDDLGRDYKSLVESVMAEGEKSSPRGEPTIEVENAVIHLSNPRQSLPVGWGRKYSRGILAAELMQWVSGTSDLRQLRAVSKERFLNYSDDGERLYGAYGPRAYATLDRAVAKLAEDPDSRQAIAVLWRGDEVDQTKDLPCTLSWGFRIRDGGLHMTTSMRSNDVWKGVTYDITCMTRIGDLVAWSLGLELTDYFHLSYSLHAYESDLEAIDSLTWGADDHKQPPLLSDLLDDWLDSHGAQDIARSESPSQRWRYARDVLATDAMDALDELPVGFDWYSRQLSGTPRSTKLCPSCRYWVSSRHTAADCFFTA